MKMTSIANDTLAALIEKDAKELSEKYVTAHPQKAFLEYITLDDLMSQKWDGGCSISQIIRNRWMEKRMIEKAQADCIAIITKKIYDKVAPDMKTLYEDISND